ncbi:hypothetical protein HAX54_051136, partial [Datura stramonium]|nr:hypothetical protein [Datura stramonium]
APKQVEITESSSLNIDFYLDNPTICNNNVWEVEGFPGRNIPMFLSTNGMAGDPLKEASWFQIKRVNSINYKLVFCPFGEYFCSDIGITDVHGQRRLALGTGNIFYFVFIKGYLHRNKIDYMNLMRCMSPSPYSGPGPFTRLHRRIHEQ